MATAIELTNTLFDYPVWENSPCYGDFYKEHPVMSRAIFMPLAAIRGVGKVFLFPLICAVGAVALPLMGIFKTIWNSRCGDGWEYVKAGGICVLGAAFCITFMMVSAYHLPLIASSSIFLGAVLVSITVHVYRASDVFENHADARSVHAAVLGEDIGRDAKRTA